MIPEGVMMMFDKLVDELEAIVRETHADARFFSVALHIRREDHGWMLDGVHVGWFVDTKQFSLPMWHLRDYPCALREFLIPAWDPILIGA